MPRLLKISVFFLSLFVVGICIYETHPILIKLAIGTARYIGPPVNALVYSNGKLDKGIRVYRIKQDWDGSARNAYLLGLSEYDSLGMLRYVYIDLNENWVGRSICTNEDCYAVVFGGLFQSETGDKYVPFQVDMKGYGFDPHLLSSERQFIFNMPPHLVKFDPLRVVMMPAEPHIQAEGD